MAMENQAPKNEPFKPILTIGLALLVFAAPWPFGCAHSWATFAASAFVFALLLVTPYSFFQIKNIPYFLTLIFLIVLGLVVYQRFSASLNPYGTESELIKWGALSVLFLLILHLPRKNISLLLLMIGLVGFFQACYGFYEVYLGQDTVLWRSKGVHAGFVTGSYFNRNHFAGLLELSLGVQLGFLFQGLYQKKKVFSFLITILLCITSAALVQSGSRMGLLSLGFSFIIMSFFMIFVSPKFFLMCLVLLLSASGLFLWQEPQVIERLQDIELALAGWDGGRLLAWESARAMLDDFLLFGVGLGSFGFIFPFYQSEQLLLSWGHLHNDYFELLIELGLPAFSLFVIFFGGLFLVCFVRFFNLKKSDQFLAWGILISILSMGFHAAVDFNFALFANNLLYISLWAMLFKLTNTKELV